MMAARVVSRRNPMMLRSPSHLPLPTGEPARPVQPVAAPRVLQRTGHHPQQLTLPLRPVPASH